MPRWLAWLVCGFGAAVIVAGLHQSRLARETRSYTRTRGRIVRAEVEEIPRPSEEGGPEFRPVVRYAFEAHGRTYESERMSIGSPAAAGTSYPQDAQRVIDRHPSGTEVDVWFDPRDPRRSVLVRGIPSVHVIATVALGIALVGLGMFVLAR